MANRPVHVVAPKPSALEGVSRLLDFAGSSRVRIRRLPAVSETATAMATDWDAVGEDLRKALISLLRERG